MCLFTRKTIQMFTWIIMWYQVWCVNHQSIIQQCYLRSVNIQILKCCFKKTSEKRIQIIMLMQCCHPGADWQNLILMRESKQKCSTVNPLCYVRSLDCGKRHNKVKQWRRTERLTAACSSDSLSLMLSILCLGKQTRTKLIFFFRKSKY